MRYMYKLVSLIYFLTYMFTYVWKYTYMLTYMNFLYVTYMSVPYGSFQSPVWRLSELLYPATLLAYYFYCTAGFEQ